MTIVVVMGVSGSGKTTIAERVAERLGWRLLEGDAFHPPANVAKMRAGTPLTDADRWPWLRAIAAEADNEQACGRSVVVACSALKRAYRDVLLGERPDAWLVYLRGSHDVIAARLRARTDHFMPPGLLDSQFATLEEPSPEEDPIVVPIDEAPPIIVDRIINTLPRRTP